MKIYLDNCCYNRPYDDRQQQRVDHEALAVEEIQARIAQGELELAWSFILDFEIDDMPPGRKKTQVLLWEAYASENILITEEILVQSEEFQKLGLRAKDALHITCAIAAECDYFVTTDDRMLRRLKAVQAIQTLNPVDFLGILSANE